MRRNRSPQGGRIVCGAALAAVLCGALAAPASAQSITDRFRSLFGGSAEPPATAAPNVQMQQGPTEADGLTCPDVEIRFGASTYAVGLPGKPAVGSDLRYQASITRTARDCTVNNGQITARIGIQGRVIAGPAGSPPTVDIPIRVAVVHEAITPKTITTKAYQTSVSLGDANNVPFSLVAEDIVYPVPTGTSGDSYVFYIGFDPQALKPAARGAARKK
jgi:hypothetical protein